MTAGTPPDCRPGCTIGARADFDVITADLAAGKSLRATSAKFGIPKTTLLRHAHKCGSGRVADVTDPAPRGSLLSRSVEDKVVNVTKAGGYAWVAAESAGISMRTFVRWMERGQEDDEAGLTRSPFRRFYLHVREARAQARAYCESRVARDRPLEWLRYGPGRERPGAPGWTDTPETIQGDTIQNYLIVFDVGGPKAVPNLAAALPPAIETTACPTDEAGQLAVEEKEGGDGQD